MANPTPRAFSLSATPEPGGLARRFEPVLRPLFHTWWRFARGLTLGVRGCVRDAQGHVFLVKHSYTPGWHMPGGGVEAGETALEALTRELAEEGNIHLAGVPRLHGVFHNVRTSARDHVLVYAIAEWHQPSPPVPDREIIAHGFFDPADLPRDTTPATRRRLAEIIDGEPPSPTW